MTDAARDLVEEVARVLEDVSSSGESLLSNATPRARATNAVRVLCKYFGGQVIYWPTVAHDSGVYLDDVKTHLRSVLSGAELKRCIDVLARYQGGGWVYMPVELSAFRDEIADEVYRGYDGTKKTMAELCRKFKTSYGSVYRLYKRGRLRARIAGAVDKSQLL